MIRYEQPPQKLTTWQPSSSARIMLSCHHKPSQKDEWHSKARSRLSGDYLPHKQRESGQAECPRVGQKRKEDTTREAIPIGQQQAIPDRLKVRARRDNGSRRQVGTTVADGTHPPPCSMSRYDNGLKVLQSHFGPPKDSH